MSCYKNPEIWYNSISLATDATQTLIQSRIVFLYLYVAHELVRIPFFRATLQCELQTWHKDSMWIYPDTLICTRKFRALNWFWDSLGICWILWTNTKASDRPTFTGWLTELICDTSTGIWNRKREIITMTTKISLRQAEKCKQATAA